MSDEEKTPAVGAHQRRADAPGEGARRAEECVLAAIRGGWRERGDIVRYMQFRSLPWSRADIDGALRRLKAAGRIVHKDRGWEVAR